MYLQILTSFSAKELGFMVRSADVAKSKYFSVDLPAEKAEDYFKRLQVILHFNTIFVLSCPVLVCDGYESKLDL